MASVPSTSESPAVVSGPDVSRIPYVQFDYGIAKVMVEYLKWSFSRVPKAAIPNSLIFRCYEELDNYVSTSPSGPLNDAESTTT
jgi:hypothetical protein